MHKLYNFRTKYWSADRSSTGGETKERENQIQKLSVCVAQSVFTESAKSELVNSTSAFAPTSPISTVSGKLLEHDSGEQHRTSASKVPRSIVHISERCARVAIPAVQHMMCQLLYIGWVRKRLIKDKHYSSPCNISATLASFTGENKNKI